MDAVVCQDPTKKPPRLRYERDTILAIKEHALVSDPDVDDALFRLNTVAQRSGRGKSKCTQSKTLCDRSRDAGGIILGPQKRTWNTGCHVSYPAGRDANDVGFSRGGKVSCDYRTKEKQLGRHQGEYRQDFRGTGRDRGGLRRNDCQFSRGRFHDRHGGQRLGHCEEEPEWFSEGPTTVSETIELGRVLEDEDGDNTFSSGPKAATSPTSPAVNDGKEIENVSQPPNLDSNRSQVDLPRSPESHLPDPIQLSSGETQGSRFRYLFPKQEANTDSKTNTINNQLLGLLKGSSGPSFSSQDKHNGLLLRPESNPHSVLQVENKLRSLLLGHATPRTVDPMQQKYSSQEEATSDSCTDPKPKILTVEEIEAQLNLSTKPPVSESAANSLHVETVKHPSETLTQTRVSNVTAVPTASTINLAPVLHSFALKQHQTTCTKQLQVHGPLVPFGILSNPMVRLPSVTNAMSASARINQLQHADLPTTVGFADSTYQGSTLPTWDSQDNIGTGIPGTSSVINSVLQNCMNSPGLTDFNNRSSNVLNPHTGPNINALTAPRRPIVKAQQAAPVSLGSSFSHMGANNPIDGGYNRDLDRRPFNFPAKSNFPLPTEPLNAGDKPQLSNFFRTAGGEFCMSASYGPHFGQSMNALVSGNNNNSGSIYVPTKLRAARPQSENNFAFLSQLAEMDRPSVPSLSCPKASSAFNHLLNAGIKAKTLEEIEH